MRKLSIATLPLLLFGLVACEGVQSADDERHIPPTGGDASTGIGEGDWDSGTPSPSVGPGTGTVEPGQLTAGEFDDNLNWDTYTEYVDGFLEDGTTPAYGIHDSITVRVVNQHDQGISNARIELLDASMHTLYSARAGSDGQLILVPGRDGFASVSGLTVAVFAPDDQPEVTPRTFDAPAGARWTFELPEAPGWLPSALDLAFVVDATGSMGDEMRYVQAEVQSIVEMIQNAQAGISMRYALIVYRDTTDEYVTRVFDFTDDLDSFSSDLAEQMANGGGDYPEAVDEAMVAMNQLSWRPGNVARVSFFIADAPPHDELVGETFDALDTTRSLGIRLYPVAASGVADLAEYVMRTMAQTTMASYLFITDDSGVGGEHAEPHIPCYNVQLLNTMMARMVNSELNGQYINPADEELIRTEGNPVDGVCNPPYADAPDA